MIEFSAVEETEMEMDGMEKEMGLSIPNILRKEGQENMI